MSTDWVFPFITQLNTLTPTAIIGLLGLIIFLLVKSNQKVHKIEHNDLHGLGEHLENISEALGRIERKLAEDLAYLKAKLNGK